MLFNINIVVAKPKIIFVASSAYPKIKKNKNIMINTAASSVLARQIINGAKCDEVILASKTWMHELEKRSLIVKNSKKIFMTNKLVLVVPKKSKLHNQKIDFENIKKIATGDPSHVPLGQYAKKYFQEKKLWERIKNKILPAPNARTALLWVEQGLADVGVIYKSDAIFSKKIKMLSEFNFKDKNYIKYISANCVHGSQ